jgi:metal-responsive CopG/Arc/MetJ family transcriptional regulator
MKVKTSVTLSEELLTAIDRLMGQRKNRSDRLETAAWAFIEGTRHDALGERDREIINHDAERLNAEASDVLDYQWEGSHRRGLWNWTAPCAWRST